MSQKTKIEFVKREIIESQILLSLAEGDKVAIICSPKELDLVISALDMLSARSTNYQTDIFQRSFDMAKDLRQLREEAFG